MDFSLNDDHLALRDAVRRFCDGEYPAEHRGNAETLAKSAQRWRAMAELGLLGLPFDADMGGTAQGAIEVMLVAQELGRALGGGAFVASTVMAGELLRRLASEAQQRQWLPAMAQSRIQAAVALYEEGMRYDWQRVRTRATETPEGYVLEGRKTLVLHGDTADLLLVAARCGEDGGSTVFAVDARAPGVHVQGFDTLDGRRAAHVRFDRVVVSADRMLGARGAADAAIDVALDAAIAALCAEAAGAVEALLAHTAEHLRTRKQFGAPLAKFQVLQHRVADMAIGLEQLKSMACAAAMAVDGGDTAKRRRLVSAAKVLASQQGRQIALAAIQMHGAMGMTDECRVGHYAKRLMVIGQLFGDAAWHLRRVSAARD
ncbi:acyl-CoA dehydrogenase family protein [Variovorax sp. YR216]|uniref:acyl-CoA dehydrogenase family protein n=1 Tax=Variovorax sp. YR216 TaxID=1882828 RepID=UPI000899E5D6|nr:acyl-CoA dehydrogenase [Variovorax sp. YR216]SEB24856.1 pimeloyl-CoA dehydrogenase [Variovorax sp. YR216]